MSRRQSSVCFDNVSRYKSEVNQQLLTPECDCWMGPPVCDPSYPVTIHSAHAPLTLSPPVPIIFVFFFFLSAHSVPPFTQSAIIIENS